MKNTKIKLIALIMVLVVVVVAMCGCNMQMVDTTWKFDRAVVNLMGDCVIEGVVQSWKDFDDGDMIQVKIDGVTYLTHSSNVVLIAG